MPAPLIKYRFEESDVDRPDIQNFFCGNSSSPIVSAAARSCRAAGSRSCGIEIDPEGDFDGPFLGHGGFCWRHRARRNPALTHLGQKNRQRKVGTSGPHFRMLPGDLTS